MWRAGSGLNLGCDVLYFATFTLRDLLEKPLAGITRHISVEYQVLAKL
jgi:hypothetical protein